eukprot:15359736-Ditylum_brightwellii.AAC.1
MQSLESATKEANVEGKLNKKEKETRKRNQSLSTANLLIVNVVPNFDMATLDSAMNAAIKSTMVENVVLSSVRSVDEVKIERKLATHCKLLVSPAGCHRLSDNENANTPTYYVNMTPTIIAIILYFFFFAWLAFIRISCINTIQVQDMYTKKYPTIRREA